MAGVTDVLMVWCIGFVGAVEHLYLTVTGGDEESDMWDELETGEKLTAVALLFVLWPLLVFEALAKKIYMREP